MILIGLVASQLGSAGRAGAAAPLPPPRPSAEIDGAPRPADRPAPSGGDGPASPGCLADLAAAGATAEPVSQPAPTMPACRIEEPVRLSAITDARGGGRRIVLSDRPIVGCRFAVVFATWVAQDALSALGRVRGKGVKALRTGPGFECRGRNRQVGAKLSAHATGTAIDVAGFDFVDGTRLDVERAAGDPGFAAMRAAACGRFTTVLGPGSDLFHANHLHLDTMQHGRNSRYRICQ